jgi:hypothetical protein
MKNKLSGIIKISILFTILIKCSVPLNTIDVKNAYNNKNIPLLIRALSEKKIEVREEAYESLKNIGKPATSELINVLQNENAINKCGYCGLILGEINAKEAIPILIEKFPHLKEVQKVIIYEKTFQRGSGIYDYKVIDRRIIRIKINADFNDPKTLPQNGGWYTIATNSLSKRFGEINAITTNIIDSIPEIQMLKNKYNNYIEIADTVDLYHAEYYFTSFNQNSVYDYLYVPYIIYSGAYSLHLLTGLDFGNDQNKWKNWWNQNKIDFQSEK